MRILWNLFKLVLALAIAIPLLIVALATTLGILGTLLGLAVLTVKLACFGLVGYGLYRLARHLLSPAPAPSRPVVRDLPAPDHYYEAAMRELDSELRG